MSLSLSLSQRTAARSSKRISSTPVSAMNVLVIEDEPTVAETLYDGLRADGHTLHTRSRGDALIDEIARLQPDMIVVNLDLNDRHARELVLRIRNRFAYVYLVVYTTWTAHIVRTELRPDLVLPQKSPAWLALQLRCFARYV